MTERPRRTLLARTLRFGGVASLALAPFSATAQDPFDLGSIDLQSRGDTESYVADTSSTGLKADIGLVRTPLSLSRITRGELDDRAPRQLDEALAYTAGVTASAWGVDDRFTQFTLRGFDLGTSGIYRDGLPNKVLDFSGFTIEPYTVESIDVLRGPASVLYGENDAAGMVNVISKRPRFRPAAEAFASYGSQGTVEAGTDFGGPLGAGETLAYRVVTLARDGETEIDGSENDRFVVAPSLTWQITPSTEVTFLAQLQNDRLTPNLFLPVAGEDYAASLGALPRSFAYDQSPFNRFDTEQRSVGYALEHRFAADLSFRQNLRWQEQETDYRHFYYTGMADADTMAFAAFTVHETATRFALDNQMEWRPRIGQAETTLLAGLDYGYGEVDGRNGFDGSYEIDVADPSYDVAVADPAIYLDRAQTTRQTGLYLQGTAEFDGGLTLVTGLRQSWVETELQDRLGGSESEADYDAFTKMAGVSYRFANGVAPYASYTESFSTNTGTDAAGDLYDPTRGEQIEAGIKWQPADRDALVTLALFQIEKTNVLTADLANPGFQIQTGEVRHRGLEAEAKASLARGLSLTGSYTYVDAEITRSNDGDEGNRPPRAPEHQAALWADYEITEGRFDGLGLGAGVRYVGDTWGDAGNTRRVDDYTIADASLRYDFGEFEARLTVTNLFDNDYFATCDPFAGCIRGEGRQVTARLSRQF